MKKIIQFIKNNSLTIVLAFVLIAFLVSFVVPLFIAMGRDMWNMAINDPYMISK